MFLFIEAPLEMWCNVAPLATGISQEIVLEFTGVTQRVSHAIPLTDVHDRL
jgi:hypothetical protein